MNKHISAAAAAAALLTLAACSETGTREEGLHTEIKAIAMNAGFSAHEHEEAQGEAHAEPKRFRRADGMHIELQLGLVNLAPVELVACESASLTTLLAALNPIATAQAHGGEPGETRAAVIAVTEPDRTEFDLASLIGQPGSYCGLTVELQPGTAETTAKHGDVDESLDGVAINVAPCYYAGTVGLSDDDAEAVSAHHCVQAKAGSSARRFTLPFAAPVTLDADRRTLDLTVVSRYSEWFDGIDMDLLESDAVEQGRLVDNIVRAMHVLTGDEQPVALSFAIDVNGEQALCNGVYDGVGTGAQQDYELSDFRYYLSDLQLRGDDGTTPVTLAAKANGTSYQDESHNAALIGLAQGCAGEVISNLSLAGSARAGNYDQLCFTLGLPFALNHLDVATSASPLNVTAMSWTWLSGHKFVRVDGVGDADGARQNFVLHLGSTGCTNAATDNGAPPDAACSHPNLAEVCLDYAAIQDGGTIVADVGRVFADSDITANTAGTAPGCMSGNTDPECVAILPKLGLDFFYQGNTIPRQAQSFFAVSP